MWTVWCDLIYFGWFVADGLGVGLFCLVASSWAGFETWNFSLSTPAKRISTFGLGLVRKKKSFSNIRGVVRILFLLPFFLFSKDIPSEH